MTTLTVSIEAPERTNPAQGSLPSESLLRLLLIYSPPKPPVPNVSPYFRTDRTTMTDTHEQNTPTTY
jgi:hypothetical protein